MDGCFKWMMVAKSFFIGNAWKSPFCIHHVKQAFCFFEDLVHHPIDSQPFTNGWPCASRFFQKGKRSKSHQPKWLMIIAELI